jgi:hypothetical protein
MRLRIFPYKDRVSHFINDKGERVPSHRYREIRDGINVEPAQALKDDPEVIRILNALDILERGSRPSLGADANEKDVAASYAIAFAGDLVDYVAGWAIDHQRGLAQRTLGERELRKEQFKSPIKPTFEPRYPAPEPPDEDHRDEKEGAFRGPLDPVQTRRFLFEFLSGLAPRLVPRDVVEAIEALDYGETLPIFQSAYTSKRTGLIEFRAKLRAIMFIEYESKKGIKKRFSVDKVVDAFAVTRDAVKDWKADLRVALGKFEVEAAIERAHAGGQNYVRYLKKCEDGEHEVEQRMCESVEQAFGKPTLLREAKRYKARSKKVVGKVPKNRK